LIFRRRRDKYSIRLKYVRLLYDLKHLQNRIKVYIARLEDRVERLRIKMKELNDDKVRREYVKLLNTYMNLVSKLKVVDTALEHLMLRVETLSLLDSISLQVGMIKSLLSRVRGYVKGLPDVELIIEDLIERATELMGDFGNIKIELNVNIEDEARKIIEAASATYKRRNET